MWSGAQHCPCPEHGDQVPQSDRLANWKRAGQPTMCSPQSQKTRVMQCQGHSLLHPSRPSKNGHLVTRPPGFSVATYHARLNAKLVKSSSARLSGSAGSPSHGVKPEGCGPHVARLGSWSRQPVGTVTSENSGTRSHLPSPQQSTSTTPMIRTAPEGPKREDAGGGVPKERHNVCGLGRPPSGPSIWPCRRGAGPAQGHNIKGQLTTCFMSI